MARRLAATALRAGVDEAGVRSIELAFAHAMRTRIHRLDERDADFLHPARTVLILLDDVGVADPGALSAAALTETLRPELAPGPVPDPRALAPGTLELLDAVPRPDGDDASLVERLVSADEPARLIALTERLDHARHLQFRDRALWRPLHAQTCSAYGPVAGWTHPKLGRRYNAWCYAFERRRLAAAPGDEPAR